MLQLVQCYNVAHCFIWCYKCCLLLQWVQCYSIAHCCNRCSVTVLLIVAIGPVFLIFSSDAVLQYCSLLQSMQYYSVAH